MRETKITVDGFKIGTYEDIVGKTGVSVIIAEEGAKAGVDVRGCAPGTRETDLLKSEKTVDTVHSVVLSGGSAFGLEASSGVMDYLESKNIGFEVGSVRVPIVCSAVIFDLLVGDSRIRPNKKMGAIASERASTIIKLGNIGAGTGASVGKFRGIEFVSKGGVGYSEIEMDSGLKVGAYVVVNSFGEIYDKDKVIAGSLSNDKTSFVSYDDYISKNSNSGNEFAQGQNTTIGCVITNANLSKVDCNNVSKTAHNGLALSVRPVHTTMDGDTIFTMASCEVDSEIDIVCYLAQKAMREAVISAVKQ